MHPLNASYAQSALTTLTGLGISCVCTVSQRHRQPQLQGNDQKRRLGEGLGPDLYAGTRRTQGSLFALLEALNFEGMDPAPTAKALRFGNGVPGAGETAGLFELRTRWRHTRALAPTVLVLNRWSVPFGLSKPPSADLPEDTCDDLDVSSY